MGKVKPEKLCGEYSLKVAANYFFKLKVSFFS